MGAALFVMAIMGCGDGSTSCTEARVAQARYSSVEVCQAAMPAMLQGSTDLPYPELTATCRRIAPIVASAKTSPDPRMPSNRGS